MKKIIKLLWRPSLVVLLIYLLIKRDIFNFHEILNVLANPIVLIAGALTLIFQSLAFAARWRLIINLFEKVSFKKILRLHFIGLFFNYYVPSGVGGDIIKALKLSQSTTITKSLGLSISAADRVFGLYGMILISSLLLTVDYLVENSHGLREYLIVNILLLVFATIGLLFFSNIISALNPYIKKSTYLFSKIGSLTEKLSLTLGLFHNWPIQAKILGVNFFLKVTSSLYLALVLAVLGVQIPSVFLFFTLSCLALLASSLPIFPAGVGVGQYTFFLIFSILGTDHARASVTAITTLQIFNLAFALLGGLFFSFEKSKTDQLL